LPLAKRGMQLGRRQLTRAVAAVRVGSRG